jgi:hypothetical protein
MFLFTTTSKPTLGPTQPPIKFVLGVRRLKHEADYSPPCIVIKNVEFYFDVPYMHSNAELPCNGVFGGTIITQNNATWQWIRRHGALIKKTSEKPMFPVGFEVATAQ